MRSVTTILAICGIPLFAQRAGPPPVAEEFCYPKSSQIQVLSRVERVRYLKGKALGPAGAAIAGPVLVETVQALGSDRRIEARFGDVDGNFDFGKRNKERYFPKISMEGFDTVYFGVALGNSGEAEIRVELWSST